MALYWTHLLLVDNDYFFAWQTFVIVIKNSFFTITYNLDSLFLFLFFIEIMLTRNKSKRSELKQEIIRYLYLVSADKVSSRGKNDLYVCKHFVVCCESTEHARQYLPDGTFVKKSDLKYYGRASSWILMQKTELLTVTLLGISDVNCPNGVISATYFAV